MEQVPPVTAAPVHDALVMGLPERETIPVNNGKSRLSAVAVNGTAATEGADGSCGELEHELGVLMHGTSTSVDGEDLLPAVLCDAVPLPQDPGSNAETSTPSWAVNAAQPRSVAAAYASGVLQDLRSHCSSRSSRLRIQALRAKEEAILARQERSDMEYQFKMVQMQKISRTSASRRRRSTTGPNLWRKKRRPRVPS